MYKYFTVDRLGSVKAGATFHLINDYSSHSLFETPGLYNREDLIARIKQMYPTGLSKHGLYYLLNWNLILYDSNTGKPLGVTHHSPMIESIFEQVRRSEFPSRPSRMQSMFAWCSLEDASKFRDECKHDECGIYEVESEKAFVGDINLLYLGPTVICAYEMARKYWSAERSNNYKPEAVIPLPTVIGASV